MKRQFLLNQTEKYLSQFAPKIQFKWLSKLQDSELIELYSLLTSFVEDDDLIQF